MSAMFAGKTALVTGGGSGIGAAAARRLAMEGVAVAVVDLNLEAAEQTVSAIAASGGKAIAVRADIAREEDNVAAFDAATRAFGDVDLAFLNAGTLQPYVPLPEVTNEIFDRMIAVNLRGAFYGIRLAQARLRRGGACVVTASAAGVIGFADGLAYAASKHGVVGLVRSAARDFAGRDLRINAICPGMVETPMVGAARTTDVVPPADLQPAPYRGGLSPQQVAEAAIFLLSPAAAAVNGQAQLVDSALLSAFPPLE